MKVLFATSEIAPWVKTGGLGDVAAALPQALRAAGQDVCVLVPAYPALLQAFPQAQDIAHLPNLGGDFPAVTLRAAVSTQGVPLWLVDYPPYFARAGNPYLDAQGRDWPDNALRFGLLSRVAAWCGSAANTLAWRPDIVHANDWQTALATVYLATAQNPACSVLTVHNLAFQGLFGPEMMAPLALPPALWRMDGVEYHGWLSFLKGGLQHAQAITTVSPGYAREIQTDAGGMGLGGLLRHRTDALTGIINGIDEAFWSPEKDPYLRPPYTHYGLRSLKRKRQNKAALQAALGLEVTPKLPLFGVVSRLTGQKGLDWVAQLGDRLMRWPAQLAVLGAGEADLETAFCALAQRYPGRCAVRLGYDEALAHQIEAGADSFLMPSRFEPCGLNQMYSQRYGTPPVVRATGGLADTVRDAAQADGTGFVFAEDHAEALWEAISRAATLWQDEKTWAHLQRRGMQQDFSWQTPVAHYQAIYATLLAAQQSRRS